MNPRWDDTPRGRPCPAIIDGLQCCGSSEVLNVRHFDDRTVRYRRCLTCGHRWRTSERDDDASAAHGDLLLAMLPVVTLFSTRLPTLVRKRARSTEGHRSTLALPF